ncbi:hypothetical protein BBJ28_00017988 [Nothophytophthora sp. Chile5]|nr:hypothetical protein BBJ28_00017988 [Nothophytophthora sp. Chile5]
MTRLLLLPVALSLVLALALAVAQAVDPVNDADAPAAAAEPSRVRTTAAFERADADHNGLLDAQEFAAFTESIKQALSPFLGAFPANEAAAWGAGGLGKPRLRSGVGPTKFWSGFVSGILTIWATEIGDKTFFIAAILSMKKDRVVVFAGAIGALIVMTVLSVVMGVVATKFLPPNLTHYLGGVLVSSRSHSSAPFGPSDELTEVEEELMGKKDEDTIQAEHAEEGLAKPEDAASAADGMIKVFSQTFLMTFLAEWGDRSQIATVTLSATKDAFGVTLGAILGHSMCTGIAVVGGKFLASRISERTVTLVGGVLFVLFALHSFVTGPSAAA